MAIWLTALKVIPWVEVIAAAPLVTQAARKLFKKPQDSPSPDSAREAVWVGEISEIQALEATVSQLRAQQQSTAAILQTLAAQSGQITTAIDVLRVHQRWLMILCLGLCIVVIGLMIGLFF